jgi:Rrf2 family transcriptional regulator, iron-sulfur cluster assembly transcription factor
MIYSRSSEYAIRAFVHLAQAPGGRYAMVKNIAAQEDIPAHFLAKILQQLARKGLLISSKGPTGGFALRTPPDEIRLLDIVEALDGLECFQQCAAGHAQCSDSTPCCMHDSWAALRSRIIEYLGQNTIADLSKALVQKKKTLSDSQRKAKRVLVAAKSS